MAGLPKHLKENVAKSRVSGGGIYIAHGDYVFMIGSWEYKKIQDECIITELFTIDSKKKTVYEGQKEVNIDPIKPGVVCSEVANFDGLGKLSAGANARAVALGLFGYKEGAISDDKAGDTLEYCCSDAQPAKGMLIACSTFPKKKRSVEEYITGRNWGCVAVPGTGLNAPEKVAARLAALSKSSDECVRVTMAQIAELGITGGATGSTPTAPVAPTPPAPPTAPVAPPAPPAPPSITMESLLAGGWAVHPTSPGWMYKGDAVKSQADLLAGK